MDRGRTQSKNGVFLSTYKDEIKMVSSKSEVVDDEELLLIPKVITRKHSPYLNLLLYSFTIAVGLVNFGYNNVVENSAYHEIKTYFKNVPSFDKILWPLAVSIFAIGGMVGAFIGPHIAKRIGRKKTLMLNNVVVILGGILLFCTKEAKSVTILCFGRVIVGLNAGANTVIAPMYLSEIAPVSVRGSLGTLSQFGIVTGMLFGNVLGLNVILGDSNGWPYLLGLTAIIGLVQLILINFCPESPQWLIAVKNDEEQATQALRRLRGIDDVSAEVDQIKLEVARESTLQQVSVFELFTNKYYRKPLLIGVVMQLSQQLSGIGGILYYSTPLFTKVGLSEEYSQAATCGVGGLSVLMTIVVIFLVEVAGRRRLMLVGLGGMASLFVVVTICFYYERQDQKWAQYLAVVATLGSVAIFQSGPGAIPWFIVSELFSQNSISAAVSIAGPTNWLANFIVGLIFPVLHKELYPYTFIPFIVLLILFFLFTYFVVPETKGRTIAEINSELQGRTVLENERNEKSPLIVK